MNRLPYLYSTFALVATLAACSGGGGGSTGGGVTPPTNTTSNTVAFSANYLGLQSSARRVASTSSSCGSAAPDVAVQSMAGWNPPSGANIMYLIGATVTATEYNTSCQAVVGSSPTYTSSSPQVVLNPTSPIVMPSPPAGSANIAGLAPGLGQATATFSDGTTGTVNVHSYAEFGIGCNETYLGGNNSSAPGWSKATGFTWNLSVCGFTASNPASPDVSIDGNGNFVFPYGYDLVKQGITIGDYSLMTGTTSCASFISQGTKLQASGGRIVSPADGLTTAPFFLLFKTADGSCVKVYGFSIIGSMNPELLGLYAVSDTSGSFTY